MDKKYLYIVIAILVVGLFVAGWSMFNPTPEGPGKYDDFASCLNSKGAIMYGAATCIHCIEQKKLFGSSFRLISYVECPRDPRRCIAAGVEGTPTWAFSGLGTSTYLGTQTLEQLSQITGCAIENNVATSTPTQ